MYLYLYHDESLLRKTQNSQEKGQRSVFSELFVRKALKDYVKRLDPRTEDFCLEQVIIRKEEQGKPYFSIISDHDTEKKLETHYSVSHSGNWWGCLMAQEPVGFDLEICRENIDFDKIAKRFFTEEEHEIICRTGVETFFEVWVRKEAFVKYLGSGLAEGLASFSVVKSGRYLDEVNRKSEDDRVAVTCVIRALEISNEVKLAYCSGSGNLIKEIISLE